MYKGIQETNRFEDSIFKRQYYAIKKIIAHFQFNTINPQ